ncbi:hypothetical protein CVU37_07340 [candidate division BRC1 bacterium HGW-BRC1-1]|jgi:hypothetical protein|nr:MAG: hypothetical protein CVU37_07340 [candidate division BRC1 bacterium HGW-BRC1-1]
MSADKPGGGASAFYDPDRVATLRGLIADGGFSAAERALASAEELAAAINAFAAEAAKLRATTGDEAARQFAHGEWNDLTATLQDLIPRVVRVYNDLLRDADQRGAPGG